MKIGYFGNEFSHTYACAERFYAEGNTLLGYPSVYKAARAVESGELDGAVLPLENSVGGAVADTLDALKKCDIYITAQHLVGISQSLIAVKGASIEKITAVYSHPQALSQCEEYLKANLPDAKLVSVSNTGEALRMISRPDEAAIARAPLIGQEVLAEDIEDNKQNATKFVFVTARPSFSGKRVSVLFDVKHRPGALLSLLSVLYEHNLNMTHLESRPSRDGFKYWFFVEFECEGGKEKLSMVMQRLGEHAELVRFAGMY